MPDEPVAFWNGCIVPQSRAQLSLHDAGFVYGATVADLCRTFHHKLFRLPEHIARFRRGCDRIGIDLTPTDEALIRHAEEVATRNAGAISSDQELALVIVATPGPIGYYLGEPGGAGDAPPTLGIHTFPLPLSRYKHFLRDGVSLVVPLTRHVPRRTIDPSFKHRSRLHWWLAEQEVRQMAPGSVALLLESQGRVTETAIANFLIVHKGIVISPPRTSILRGVSLQVIEELCFQEGVPFQERPLTVEQCLSADEAMLCGTAFCLAGVRGIDGQPIPWPGPIFERLLAAWSRQAGLDIRAQILAHG
ncbi:MAG: aminotransferase class IV [Gemmataceae bacterium]|nr:aminotransferase class IV [Gemmataceae bacterium]